jgi:hypothetical protein
MTVRRVVPRDEDLVAYCGASVGTSTMYQNSFLGLAVLYCLLSIRNFVQNRIKNAT